MTGREDIERLPRILRWQHGAMVLLFALLVLTGLPMLLEISPGMKSFMSRWELFQIRGWVHRIAGSGLLALSLAHLAYLLFSDHGHRELKSMIPGMQDARDAVGTFAYQAGIVRLIRRAGSGRSLLRRWKRWLPRSHPRYGRYSFVEKLEYIAVVWGSFLMILTGLMLWFEEATMALFPMRAFNIVRVVHSYEAILAFLAIIVWHMYQVHLRPGAFPMSKVWLDGRISLEELRRDHPLEYEELKRRQSPASGPGKTA
jgi:cytochrome b subunit of formate dehydrogenase